jgi:hypothetical protein
MIWVASGFNRFEIRGETQVGTFKRELSSALEDNR